MVNNHSKEAELVPPLFFKQTFSFITALIFLVCSQSAEAQKLKKYYTSSIESKGAIYYIFPLKGFKNPSSGGYFVYDITYLTGHDSATVNFSYFDKNALVLDGICFTNNDRACTLQPLKKIFIESKKSKWHYRFTTKMAFADLKNFYVANHTAKISLHSNKGQLDLKEKKRTWKKQAGAITRILELISLNQQK